ncbi:alpha/beta fold hydrolase [Amycolatopsis sp. CA-161197]|uniref:alpha/beta fold hydrolase n=1 Tax=Amycolatopsis sp. CA-161197 TaxID=3239922 RepID=UPI003D8D5C3E
MKVDGAPLGEHYEIAGRRLLLHRSGAGGPAVVFLPGAGLMAYDFLNVQQRVAEFTTSVVYDRAGTGWSATAELPRTPDEVTDELRALLAATDVPGPYVLAGHSLGALYARRYAQRFPEEVTGLVFLDPGHEDILEFLPAEAAELNESLKPDPTTLPEPTIEQLAASRDALLALYAAWPDDVREALVDKHLTEWRTAVLETQNFETTVYDQVRAGGGLPDVPLVVLSALGANPYWAQFASPELMREMLAGIKALHASIAASVPRGEHRVLDGAAHQTMHLDHEDAVVEAIRSVF